MVTRVRNSTAGEPPPPPAVGPDGQPCRLEMIYAGGSWRGYADTPAELMSLLIEGYEDLPPAEQTVARLRYAVDVHVPVQASLAAAGPMDACTPGEREVVLSPRDHPPEVPVWDAPVPLVLVSAFYAPAGPRLRPRAGRGEIVWIDPGSDGALLESLAAAGWIGLAVRDDAAPASRGN
jgi:hypothetical protein